MAGVKTYEGTNDIGQELKEEISITIPANALETFITAQRGSGIDTSNGQIGAQLLESASAARSEVFPCVKKHTWSDQIQLRMVHN